jgi:pyruvate,orthophosphate dikinase
MITSEAPDLGPISLYARGRESSEPAIVGAKAANLLRLAEAGLPVPPGFVLGTEVCAQYQAHRLGEGRLAELVVAGMDQLERDTGRRFGASRRPLLVAVRSGAAVSMPGMLDTVLDVGLCDASLPGLLAATGDPAAVWDSYRRLIQSYAEVVAGCPPEPFRAELDAALTDSSVADASELDVSCLRKLVARLLLVYHSLAGTPFPQEPRTQLLGAVEAVFGSWNSPRAVEYRRIQHLSGLRGTAVTVQTMVFGNLGARSGSGVAFTRDPATGQNRLYFDFLPNAQGEDIVGGRLPVASSDDLLSAIPGVNRQLGEVRRTLEQLFGDAQDFEFTVEDGKLWLLQTRTAKRTALAALQIACDLVDEGVIDEQTALARLGGYDLEHVVLVELEGDAGVEAVGSAVPASGGVATGAIALDVDSAIGIAAGNNPVILVREHASTADIAALAVCRGLLTASGSRTSHAAVVARQLGVVCLVNCTDLRIDLERRAAQIGANRLHEHDALTIDGSTGLIYPGTLRRTERQPLELLERVRTWTGGRRGMPGEGAR